MEPGLNTPESRIM